MKERVWCTAHLQFLRCEGGLRYQKADRRVHEVRLAVRVDEGVAEGVDLRSEERELPHDSLLVPRVDVETTRQLGCSFRIRLKETDER